MSQPLQTPSVSRHLSSQGPSNAPATVGGSRIPMRRPSVAGPAAAPATRLSGLNRRTSVSAGTSGAPATVARMGGTLKRDAGVANLPNGDEPVSKKMLASSVGPSLATPSTSRHLAPLPPSTLRASLQTPSSTNITSASSAAETALLAYDRVRVLTTEVASLTSKLKEQDISSREATTKILLLERRLGEAERDRREADKRANESGRRVQKLEADRGVVEGRKDEEERERREAVTKAEEALRKSKVAEEEAREELDAAHAANESLEQEVRQLRHAAGQCETRLRAADERLQMLEKELTAVGGESRGWREKYEAEARKREEVERKLEGRGKRADEEETETRSAMILRDELHRQVTHLKTLESANSRMSRELAAYKAHQTNIELLKEQNRSLSSQLSTLDTLRAKLSSAKTSLTALEREREEWQAFLSTDEGLTFSGPSDLSKALAAARIESVSLRERLGTRDAEIKARDRLVSELEEQMERLEQEKEDELEKRRRAEGAAERAERGRDLDRRRAEMLAEQLRSYAREEETMLAERKAGGNGEGGAEADKKHREMQVQHLEELLEAHKRELGEVNKEASRLRGLLETQGGRTMDIAGVVVRGGGQGAETGTPSTSPVKASLAKQIQITEELEKECDELADENDLLKKTIESLELKVDHLSLALGRGEYNVATTRVFELEGSPAQRDLAVRTATLEALKSENRALLDKLSQLEKRNPLLSSTEGESIVPRESLDALRTEVGQLQKDLAQRDIAKDRLSKAFASKAREFREAVHSLLGYKLDFEPDGRVRVRSVFAPSDDYALVFKSGKEDRGTMALVGGGNAAFNVSQEVRTQMRFWVTERGCIPGFLASLTIELFEGTTRGRAGGFVGM